MENNGNFLCIPKKIFKMFKRRIENSQNRTCFICSSIIKEYWNYDILDQYERRTLSSKYKLMENDLGYLYFNCGDAEIFLYEKVNNKLIKKVLDNLKKKTYWNEEKMEALISLISEDKLKNWCNEFRIVINDE